MSCPSCGSTTTTTLETRRCNEGKRRRKVCKACAFRWSEWIDVDHALSKTKTCLQCQHWQKSRCDLSLKDPEEIGVIFARECNLYKAAPCHSSP